MTRRTSLARKLTWPEPPAGTPRTGPTTRRQRRAELVRCFPRVDTESGTCRFRSIIPCGLRPVGPPRATVRGVFLLVQAMTVRVAFLIDGFNLYHSLRDAQNATGSCVKWLDIRSLCASYLPQLGREARLESVTYFSALATHLASRHPDTVNRHQILIRALKATGVRVEMGRFKKKTLTCHSCGQVIERHEEKETDVALSVSVVEQLTGDLCDICVIVSGDTDIAPAIRTARRLAPEKRICVVTPFRRSNAELQQVAHQCFRIRAETYARHLLPNPLTLPDGTQLTKPLSW